MRKIVFAVAGYACDVEALDKIIALLSIAIHHVVSGAPVVALIYLHVHHVLAHENLIGHAHHLVFAIAMEHQNIVDIRAVAHELVFFQPRSDKSLTTVNV